MKKGSHKRTAKGSNRYQSLVISLPSSHSPPTFKGVNTEQGLSTKKLAIAICVAIVLLTGLAIGVFIHNYQAAVYEAFVERSTAYAATFADATNAWLERGDEETARTVARFLLLGSAFYVQAISGTTVLIDERLHEADPLDLSPPSIPLANRAVEYRRLDSGRRLLDVIVPGVSSQRTNGELESGYVRIGVDAATIGARIRSMTLITSGIGFAFDGLVIGFLLWVLRRALRPPAKQQPPELSVNERSSRPLVIAHGSLQIDEATKHVALFGKEVPLTPKQYALLHLLASDPGRVFSDKEILAAVWPTSSYADSKDVKQQVYLLRRRLTATCADAAKMIVNVPGFGYKLVVPVIDEDLTEC